MILSEILENQDKCGGDMQSQCNVGVSISWVQNWQVLKRQVILMLDGAGTKRNKWLATVYVCKYRLGNKVLLGCHYWE